MSLFVYEALDASGRRHKGELEAESERAARQQVRGRQWVLRKLHPVAEKETDHEGQASHRRLSTAEVTTFLQQLATLTSSGMALTESLASIAEGMESKRGRRGVANVRQHVLEGGSLAEALRRQHFDAVVCNMVEAGEESGQLEAVSVRLAELLEHRQKLHQDLLSATLYPAIILGFGVVVMLFLLAVVVPQVVSVFEHTGGELPWLTTLVIAASSFLRDFGGWLLLGGVLLLVGYRLLMRDARFKARRDSLLLQLPLVAKILAKTETARFARTLGMLLTGGVPVLMAMHIANQSFVMEPFRQAGEQAREALREGGNLSASFRNSGLLPFLAVRLMDIGEQSGSLDRMLLKVAASYEQETARSLKRLLTIMEPLLVLLMAVAVGALAMAILLPIVEMNELVR